MIVDLALLDSMKLMLLLMEMMPQYVLISAPQVNLFVLLHANLIALQRAMHKERFSVLTQGANSMVK